MLQLSTQHNLVFAPSCLSVTVLPALFCGFVQDFMTWPFRAFGMGDLMHPYIDCTHISF